LGLALVQKIGNLDWNWQDMVFSYGRSIGEHHIEILAVYIGLELGAMSHYLSDWGGSAYKRFKKKGLSGWRPPKTIKRSKIKAPTRASRKSIAEGRRKKEEGRRKK
jgi:uncharacterized metal-binding protein